MTNKMTSQFVTTVVRFLITMLFCIGKEVVRLRPLLRHEFDLPYLNTSQAQNRIAWEA